MRRASPGPRAGMPTCTGVRRLLAAAAVALASVSAAAAQEAPLTLERLEAMALANNPTLGQARTQVEASRGRARAAGAFPNPIVGYSAEEMSFGPVIQGGEHGIFVERQCEMVTDGVRALILEYFGYSTKVFEFISDQHTPKNVLIVGQRTNRAKDPAVLEKIAEAKSFFGIRRHYLETATGLAA